MNVNVQRNCAVKLRQHFIISYLQVFHINFNIRFRRLVLLEMISFEKIFKTVQRKFVTQCK